MKTQDLLDMETTETKSVRILWSLLLNMSNNAITQYGIFLFVRPGSAGKHNICFLHSQSTGALYVVSILLGKQLSGICKSW